MKNFLFGFLKKKPVFKKKTHRFDLIIYDDIYPHPSSGFRLEEFTSLLTSLPNSKAIISGYAYKYFNLPAQQHQEHTANLISSNPALANKLEFMEGNININCKLFYCVFLHNMFALIETVDQHQIPFAFTLYPGGGFNPGTEDTYQQLRRIFSSPNFKKVIVTQQRTYDYLLSNKLCKESDIQFIFGVVVPQESLLKTTILKSKYTADKPTFDICFCATKYTEFGEDKGYPLFIEFIKAVAAKYNFTRFHVVGGFDKNVIPVDITEDRIKFYGYQHFDKLKLIFNSMDLIVSPNQPGKLGKGAFDGFPLGTVIEAAFNEVAVMLTDCFNENKFFEDGVEIIIIKPSVDDMVKKFEQMISSIDIFYCNAKKGKEKFRQLYSTAYQMNPRIGLLKSLMAEKTVNA